MSQQSTPRSYGRIRSDVTHNSESSESQPTGCVGRRSELTARKRGDAYDVGVAGVFTPRELSCDQQQALGRGPPSTRDAHVGRIRSDVTHPQNQGATAIPATCYPQQIQVAGWHGRAKSSLATGAGRAGDLIAYDYKESIARNLSERHRTGVHRLDPGLAPHTRRFDAASDAASDAGFEVAMVAAEARSGGGTPRAGQSPKRHSPIGFRQLDYKKVQQDYEARTGDVGPAPNYGRRKTDKHGKILTNMYGFLQ